MSNARSIAIKDVSLTDNIAKESGGALHLENSLTVGVEHIHILHNSQSYGGFSTAATSSKGSILEYISFRRFYFGDN